MKHGHQSIYGVDKVIATRAIRIIQVSVTPAEGVVGDYVGGQSGEVQHEMEDCILVVGILEAGDQFVDLFADHRGKIHDRAFGEVICDDLAAQTVVVMADCSDERVRGTERDGVLGVFGTFARSRSVDFFVIVGVFDMEFMGTDSDDGA